MTAMQRRRKRRAATPTTDAAWNGPIMDMDGGGWEAMVADPFTWTDPSFNNGVVTAIVDDGNGGKFVGGSFTSVTCNVTSTTYTTGYTRLIHLLPNGEVDADWSCAVTGTVWTLAIDAASDRLYVGGDYNGTASIGGANRDRLAVVTASTGVVVSDWVCNVDGDEFGFGVSAIALDVVGDRLYIGHPSEVDFFADPAERFTDVGGEARIGLAAITASTGVVVADWVCDIVPADDFAPTNVYALVVDASSDRLYVAGGWGNGTVGGEARVGLVAITASTGLVAADWVCNATNTVRALAFDAASDRLYVAGQFNGTASIGGENRDRLAAVTASTGVVVSDWTCNVTSASSFHAVWALAFDASTDRLYVAGQFNGGTIGGESRDRLAAVTASTGVVVTGWTCNVSGNIVFNLAFDAANDVLHVVGSFRGATVFDGVSRDAFGTANATAGGVYVP